MNTNNKEYFAEVIDKLTNLNVELTEESLKPYSFAELDYAIARLQCNIGDLKKYNRCYIEGYSKEEYEEKANDRIRLLDGRMAWIYDP